jgi:hypothetical protein
MTAVLEPQVVTRRGPTVHEDIGEKLKRLSSELWNEYTEKLDRSEELTGGPGLFLVVTSPEKDHLLTVQTIRSAWRRNAVLLMSRHAIQVLGDEPQDPGREFRDFYDYLHAWKDAVAIATRATSETSSLVSFFQAPHHGAVASFAGRQLFRKARWTDEKNQRRCELVDKEIEGTLSAAEAAELQKLQTEMLEYRRKVAPLALDQLRELHRALLDKAGNETK